jgi:tRNA A-37 threonylcarbamoyl transferase component Bud32
MVVSKGTALSMREPAPEANGRTVSGPSGLLTVPGLPRLHQEILPTDGAAVRGSLLDLEGPIFDGRFRIEARIAEGGFAVVYRAWQLALERRVALKVLKPPRNQDPIGRAEFREKFAAEAKTIARLRHPDIVDVYDFSVATLPSGELAPWMALEWLDGDTLALELGRRHCAGQRGRDPAEAVNYLRPVIRALAHAHEQGIVHRDIKPSNIMLTETPHGPSLRVLDFGIAKIMVDTHAPNTGNTRTESLPAFSPAYAAPEQVAFSRTGPWTDVHALGLVLTEVMTDEPPFSDRDPEAHFFEQVMAGRRPTPASKGRDVGAFEPILAKALALAPRERWRNAAELMAALDQAVLGRATVEVTPARTAAPASPRPAARAGLWRRVPFARAVIVAAVVLLALSLVGLTLSRSTSKRLPQTGAKPLAPESTRAAEQPARLEPTLEREIGSNLGVPPPAAAAPPSPVRIDVRRRKRASIVPTPKVEDRKGDPKADDDPVRDGRDLFNDTK